LGSHWSQFGATGTGTGVGIGIGTVGTGTGTGPGHGAGKLGCGRHCVLKHVPLLDWSDGEGYVLQPPPQSTVLQFHGRPTTGTGTGPSPSGTHGVMTSAQPCGVMQ